MKKMQSVREFDIKELYKEARNRWLKPTELLFILQNYEKQDLIQETPQYPSSGSLFLFNRRVHRFFRKDGHVWRKKRDGRTIGEAHERLKVENVDTLNCYYAHGEQNPNFQRRCYWILDPAWDHIVLVHYREVTEGRYSAGSILNFSTESNSPFSLSAPVYNAQNSYEQCWSSCSPGESVEEVSSNLFPENNDLGPLDGPRELDTSSGQEVSQALRRLAEQLSLDGDDNSINFLEKLPPYCSQNEVSQDSGLWAYEKESSPHIMVQDDLNRTVPMQCTGEDGQLDGPEIPKDSWNGMLERYSSSFEVSSHEKSSDKLTLNGVPVQNFEIGLPLTHAASSQNDRYLISSSQQPKYPSNTSEESEVLSSHGLSYCLNDTESSSYYPASGTSLRSQLSAARRFLLDSDDPIDSPTSSRLLQEVEKFTLSTYSYGTSIQETNSSVAMFPKTISIDSTQTTIDNNIKLTPDYYGAWFDQESRLGTSLGSDSSLTVAQVQRFSIREVSPEWSYSDSPEATKVIITGDFLCNSSEFSWACMFDGIEVPVEVIQEGVFRCHAPSHSSGKVSLCITSGNGESCSEVREFEFRSKPHDTSIQQRESETPMDKEELVSLVRFAQVLLHGFDSLSVQKEDCAESETQQFRKGKIADDPWGRTIEELLFGGGTPFYTMKWILEELLKDKLQQWVSSRHKEGGEATRSLSKQEQGMIHMIAALGYEWALYPILTSGVGINFRDVNGWTALHWAAQFGREKMVAALIAAGAAAGAVTDPTSQDPSGKSPASVAAASGHKGLAGYLSEVALTSYLSSLTLEENEISKGSAAVEAERTVNIISNRNAQILTGAIEDELSLKDSLAAVRNAAQAAARIQAAFRTHSFRRRQQRAASCCDEYGMTPEGISALSKMQRAGWCHPDHSLSKAALSIQKNYRGWKRRKEFLNLRQNVVKIQAHVRGHQVRKYRELIWTVGILEKAILRWRRRRVGLRGFRAEQEPIEECEEQEEDILKVFRKHKVDAALINDVTRVLSMAESPEARQQYRRLQESYRQAKAELNIHTTVTTSSSQGNGTNMEDEDYMYHFT